MMEVFDTKELDLFTKELLKIANDTMPKESRKFLRKEGKSLLEETQSEAISCGINHKEQKYYNAIKQGKVYGYKRVTRGKHVAYANRVYSNAPHGHLIEDGHRMVSKNGVETGFVRGFHVFENAAERFSARWVSDCEQFLDSVFDKGLR